MSHHVGQGEKKEWSKLFYHSNVITWRGFGNTNKKAIQKLRLHLATCKIFSECKIFAGENIFGKGKYFQVFGYIMKIVLENVFKSLVAF